MKLWISLLLATMMMAPAAEPEIAKGSVVVLPVDGAITDAQFFFLRRIYKQAEAKEASAVILDMDTPGGQLTTTEEIIQMIQKSKVPTYTYVNTNAGSAGALIALGTKAVYMAPISAIGAAAPVLSSGEEIGETMNAKMVSYYSGYFRSVAEKNGYNPNLVDGFMNLDKEVKVGETVINPKGALLTLSAQEAVKEYGGKPLLARGIAENVEDVVKQAGLTGKPVELEPSGFESLAQWITMLAPFFLMAGMIAAYVEFKSPGFGVAGFVSALCFVLFFTGHYVAGLTGFEVMAVFLLGLILVLVELLLFPGVVLLAAVGTAMMLGAMFFAMVDLYPGQPMNISFDAFRVPMLNLGIALALTAVAIVILARFLPELPIFRRLVLATGPVRSTPLVNLKASVGDTGITRTILRPAGKAEFGEALVDVEAQGEFLEPGTPVRIISREGDRFVVEAVSPARSA